MIKRLTYTIFVFSIVFSIVFSYTMFSQKNNFDLTQSAKTFIIQNAGSDKAHHIEYGSNFEFLNIKKLTKAPGTYFVYGLILSLTKMDEKNFFLIFFIINILFFSTLITLLNEIFSYISSALKKNTLIFTSLIPLLFPVFHEFLFTDLLFLFETLGVLSFLNGFLFLTLYITDKKNLTLFSQCFSLHLVLILEQL